MRLVSADAETPSLSAARAKCRTSVTAMKFAELLNEAVYGLPEINRDNLRDVKLIAAPGCYPTTTILGLVPLLKAGWLEPPPLQFSKGTMHNHIVVRLPRWS